jgi:hypothetical protein
MSFWLNDFFSFNFLCLYYCIKFHSLGLKYYYYYRSKFKHLQWISSNWVDISWLSYLGIWDNFVNYNKYHFFEWISCIWLLFICLDYFIQHNIFILVILEPNYYNSFEIKFIHLLSLSTIGILIYLNAQ